MASQATNYITSYVWGPLYVSGRIIGEQVRSEVCLLERVREREKEAVFTKPSLALEGGREGRREGGREGGREGEREGGRERGKEEGREGGREGGMGGRYWREGSNTQ